MSTRDKRLWSTAAGLVGVFLAVYLWEMGIGALPGEPALIDAWQNRGVGTAAPVRQFLEFVRSLGDRGVAIATLVTLIAVVWEELGRRAAAGVAASATVVLVVAAFKEVAHRTDVAFFGVGPNYPSGHVAFVTAVFGYTSWATLRAGHRALGIALIVPVLVVGPSVVLLGSHPPSDALGGYALGAAWAIGATLLTRR